MIKAEILAALKQLLSKADFTAAMNDLAVWVQGKFTTLKGLIDDNVVSVSEAANATSGSVKTFDVQNAKGVSLGKVEIPADLSDYDNTTSDFQSGAQVENKVAAAVGAVHRPAGSIAPAALVAALLVKANLGKVYNLTGDATTTADWLEGAGETVKAGSDVSIVEADGFVASEDTEVDSEKTYYSDQNGTLVDTAAEGYAESNPATEGWYEKVVVYKFNASGLAIDLSNYLQPEDFETIGATEAKAIVAAAIAAAEAPAQSGD